MKNTKNNGTLSGTANKSHIDRASKKASSLFRKSRKNGRGRLWITKEV